MPHVFVIRGQFTHLACDAWMLPPSAAVGVHNWKEQVDRLFTRVAATDLRALQTRRKLTTVLADGAAADPVIVLTAVPTHGFSEAKALVPAVDEFFATAAAAIPRSGARRLIAMPFFGTAGGGGRDRRGEILDVLLEAMQRNAQRHDVNAALVLLDEDAYALAQLKRSRDRERFFPGLGTEVPEPSPQLVADARSGRLVPFMGAGVSASAGGPDWNGLLRQLAERVMPDPKAAESLLDEKRDAFGQAGALRTAWEHAGHPNERSFNKLIAEAVAPLKRYGLAPAMLAMLPANEAITLNYDRLFEIAAADVKRPRRVIPVAESESDRPADQRNERWLLKLHGSADAPDTIVLTRDDYLGYDSERGALSSLVKAMLMTRHLLFVGFGLSDDHFHEILYDVRRAVRGQGASGLDATVLKLRADPLDQLLWAKDLSMVPSAPTPSPSRCSAGGSRSSSTPCSASPPTCTATCCTARSTRRSRTPSGASGTCCSISSRAPTRRCARRRRGGSCRRRSNVSDAPRWQRLIAKAPDDPSTVGCSRPAGMTQSAVAPGEILLHHGGCVREGRDLEAGWFARVRSRPRRAW